MKKIVWTHNVITQRELQVMQLASEGIKYFSIGLELRISEQTVKNHITSILDKLSAVNKAHAVDKCYQLGIFKIEE